MKRSLIFILLISILSFSLFGQKKEKSEFRYPTYKGLVMCGYQGWHNTPTDGSERGWTHLGKRGVFAPGNCNIDLWPDVSEYKKTYKTDFKYNETSFETFKSLVPKNIEWCKTNKVDYAPLVFPGFSWRNMNGPKGTQIPRNKGFFLWKQVVNAGEGGAEMLYIAMFDEIDEGTAIYKVTNHPPVGASPFVTYEGLPSDYYLWLTGKAAKMLKKEIPLQSTIPVYTSKQ